MEQQKICRMRDVYRAIAAFEAEIERKYALNINEAMLLCTLSEQNQMMVGEVATQLGMSYPNASKMIASVEKQSLLRRLVDRNNRRCTYVELTKKGRERLADMKCCDLELPDILKPIFEE